MLHRTLEIRLLMNTLKQFAIRAELFETWLALTSVKYHGNLLIVILLNPWLAVTMLRTTGPSTIYRDLKHDTHVHSWLLKCVFQCLCNLMTDFVQTFYLTSTSKEPRNKHYHSSFIAVQF